MLYSSLSLNGTWKIGYLEEAYKDTQLPVFSGWPLENVVPAYWEDLKEKLQLSPFFRELKINPEYGLWAYPINHYVPDMALPNIMGNFFYECTFLCEDFSGDAEIYFGGVQNSLSLWINGEFLGRHKGYSTPFSIKVPKGVIRNGENTITLSVSNSRLEGNNGEPIVGLTSRAACEYTGGITGDVELRVYMSPLRDAAVFTSEDLKTLSVKVYSSEEIKVGWEVKDGDIVLLNGTSNGDFSFDAENLTLWSPENPKLYTLTLTSGDASLTVPFGVRRLLVCGTHFKLNGYPYFLRGVCEHFYIPDTIHPHHDIAYYRHIIKEFKKLGFNFIRFHTHIPQEEYMQAADELGMIIQAECPNNTTLEEWEKIVYFCRRHPSVSIFCNGNELDIDEAMIEYLEKCARTVHENTDSLYSPMSALRGVEYYWGNPEVTSAMTEKPFLHNPGRLEKLSEFSDMYNSYAHGHFSYLSLTSDVEKIDSYASLYKKPRVSHEICIDGTFTDLSLMDRYKNSPVGKTEMFSSLEKHLLDKKVLHKAPLYFKNSSQWQRRIRKYCFEQLRRCNDMSGYDFLGPIDTHWHTFGYDCGMMNEFYELKPGETYENVLRYNSETVVLTDLERKRNFKSGSLLEFGIFTSHYGKKKIENADLSVMLITDGKVILRKNINVKNIENGKVSRLYDFSEHLPNSDTPKEIILKITLDGEDLHAENQWEIYSFPGAEKSTSDKVKVFSNPTKELLTEALKNGENVVVFGGSPFTFHKTSFQIALPGRSDGHLATVIYDHPIMNSMPHDGFCGWQFNQLLEGGDAVCFTNDNVPFDPIIEVATTHKYFIRQSAMFEFNVFSGKLLVCTFNFRENDPAASYLKSKILSYAESDLFSPRHTLEEDEYLSLLSGVKVDVVKNTNLAFNPNDKTAKKKN